MRIPLDNEDAIDEEMNMNQTRKSGHDSGTDKIPGEDAEKELRTRRERIHEITQPARFNLIQDILMHPEQMPSMKELDFLEKERGRSTIRGHLDKLIERGIVAEISLEQERVKRDNPRKFFRLTESGRQELEELDLLGLEETLQKLYRDTEKPEDIVKYERAPRPKLHDQS